eukprot:TRINITY_DN3768_c0_g1_i2.p1 TRINITY_DN3768_c0_g1~~TRINITY_DN3768_c0_g1_i2.p1  ORF type:complete len:245 (-),score=81.44 TRINITY_DN3768_c0_g1_i2:70-804(-)
MERQLFADSVMKSRQLSGWEGLVFGGIVLDERQHLSQKDLMFLASIVKKYCDVVTLQTESLEAPQLSQVEVFKAALGEETWLNLSTGINRHNVASFMEHMNSFFVLTSHNSDMGSIDPAEMKAINEVIHEGKSSGRTEYGDETMTVSESEDELLKSNMMNSSSAQRLLSKRKRTPVLASERIKKVLTQRFRHASATCFAVIVVKTFAQAVTAIDDALGNGFDGVFLYDVEFGMESLIGMVRGIG